MNLKITLILKFTIMPETKNTTLFLKITIIPYEMKII